MTRKTAAALPALASIPALAACGRKADTSTSTPTPARTWHTCTYLHRREARAVRQEAARQLVDLPRLIRAVQWSQWPDEMADDCWVDAPTLRTRIDHLTDEERAAVEAVMDPII